MSLNALLGNPKRTRTLAFTRPLRFLFDVVIVRMVLVPVAITLVGSWNWYFPVWLDRLLPKLEIEGESAQHLDPEDGAELAGTDLAAA
jgi:uncharacterized membrane protein YdfJ with MMPL/SSD domain